MSENTAANGLAVLEYFLIDRAINCKNWIIAKIKLPNARVPNEVVEAFISALFHGDLVFVAVDEGSFRWKYHWAVIADNANLSI